jgi:hypothetical protein
VDNSEYPTLSHFLRDIDQIVFNAKEYNPLTLKDVRGRSIVHAAHSMGDIVESHAYNFKKEVGYDLFSQCEEIAERLHIARPIPPHAGSFFYFVSIYLFIFIDHFVCSFHKWKSVFMAPLL